MLLPTMMVVAVELAIHSDPVVRLIGARGSVGDESGRGLLVVVWSAGLTGRLELPSSSSYLLTSAWQESVDVDIEGILHVTAKARSTGKSQDIKIKRAGLSEEEVQGLL
jgi:hypothetical protein